MPNHVHSIPIPRDAYGIRRALLPKPVDVADVLIRDWPILLNGFLVSL